jgi:hypothetical protein
MECVRASIDEAQKQGIAAGIYGEDRWPSGYGAGVVAEMDSNFRSRALVTRPKGTDKK